MIWFIQIIVMLGDLFLIAACIVALTYAKNSPGNYILIYLACWVWYGMMAITIIMSVLIVVLLFGIVT